MEEDIYVEQYKKMHISNSEYGTSGTLLLDEVSIFIDQIKPRNILDYGCGKGQLVKLLEIKYPQIKIFGYDPSVKEFKTIPNCAFDFVICTDVLEHVPKNSINSVLEHISKISKNVFFMLHHEKAAAILPNGENAHCTIEPPEWYHDIILKNFDFLIPLDGIYPNTAVITFEATKDTLSSYKIIVLDKRINYSLKKIEYDFSTKLENSRYNENSLKKIEYDFSTKLENSRYNENWIKLFGIYNNKKYLKIVVFGISIIFKMNEKNINKIAWWIPVKKWRDNFRNKF